jgi:hypothetical protein
MVGIHDRRRDFIWSDVGLEKNWPRTHTDYPGGALVRGMTKPEELRIFFRVFVLS